MATIEPPSFFDTLKKFFDHLEVKFGGFRCGRMCRIRDFKKEVGDIPKIMCARLARFARKSGHAFIEHQLMSLHVAK